MAFSLTDQMGRTGLFVAIGATVVFLPLALVRRLPGVRRVL
jgi:hypothetical protein